jgi:AcrR family transcriptional regulator
MQIKKENMRNALLENAEKQFLKKGFEKASLRQIVQDSGTTIGNFYNYFESKEAMFESLVKKDYDAFMWFIQNHSSENDLEDLLNNGDLDHLKAIIVEAVTSKLPNFSKGLVLLFDASHGTQYNHVKSMVLKEVRDHFLEHLRSNKIRSISPEYGEILASQFLQGFIDILRHYQGQTQKKLLTEHILFYIFATVAMFKS